MHKYQAMDVFGIDESIDKTSLKGLYLSLIKKYHPDVNASGLHMTQLINQAYDVLKDLDFIDREGKASNLDLSEELEKAINLACQLVGVEIELCGTWLWVRGDTKQHKEALKEGGFTFHSKKVCWYWTKAPRKRRYNKQLEMDDIRAKYGSKGFKSDQHQYLGV
ncbi:MAG: DnaJ domain-containing protein [Oligoflexales bacterium]|nr:DnaJ domain-containing protein [Oligoflexales bacterium]